MYDSLVPNDRKENPRDAGEGEQRRGRAEERESRGEGEQRRGRAEESKHFLCLSFEGTDGAEVPLLKCNRTLFTRSWDTTEVE